MIVYAPNTFTPDDDEHNQNWILVIDGIDFENFHLEIFNRWGEKFGKHMMQVLLGMAPIITWEFQMIHIIGKFHTR